MKAAKKQSQFKLVLSVVEWSQMPPFGRKSEALSSKSDNSGCVAGRLLPRVDRETR